MGLEPDLVQQVAELLAQVPIQILDATAFAVAVAVGGGHGVEGLERLVGLLQEVATKAGVGLLAVPRALPAQGPHQLVETADRVDQVVAGPVAAGH